LKQVLVRGGSVVVEEVPAPTVGLRNVLVSVAYSCVSVGTELSSVKLSGLPTYRRALKQPDHARRVLELAREQGFRRTYDRVRTRLAAGLPTGYSASGTVVAVGDDLTGFSVGERVACAGAGIANHAELIDVPVNLAVKIPAGVSLDDASTVTLGAIALQGIRRAAPTLGEDVGVIGLGILGQLTVQLLRANGCNVLASDLDPRRIDLAMAHGAAPLRQGTELAEEARRRTDGFGADAVIVTAATPSDDVVRAAAHACRKKGRVVIVGDVGLHFRRADLYEKELDVLISTSYGPGRYDAVYEQKGQDYPIGYVRWTENRNMAEYLHQLAVGGVRLGDLPIERFDIDEAEQAYDLLRREGEKPLAVLLSYPERAESAARTVVIRRIGPRGDRIKVALVGAGAFAQASHIPNLVKLRDRFEVRAVMSRTGSTARAVATRAEAAYATTDFDDVLSDDAVDLVLIATRHDLHAPLTLRALEAGKHVFVEKPLALNERELQRIEQFYDRRADPLLMTGFNRRFSPAAQRARDLLSGRTTPIVADYRVNAGYIPPDHWVHGPEGGGRNIGEACHVYDLFDFLTEAEVVSVTAQSIAPPSAQWATNDNFIATIAYRDGSLCTLTYTALGHRDHSKERMELFVDGRVLTLDDYKSLEVAGGGSGWRSRSHRKGHVEELKSLGEALYSGAAWPISLDEQLRAMRISFQVEDQF
jgi:predicted dehydrogenase/threonine dehydrogenase-like Zn-dependent dehydrogenase